MLIRLLTGVMLVVAGGTAIALGDWPTVRGGVERGGYTEALPEGTLRPTWARGFEQQRIGSAVEPVVAEGRVYVTTHGGRLYALDATTGDPAWAFQTHGPILHSAAVDGAMVVAASTDGFIYALHAATGELRWRTWLDDGGAAAAPAIADGHIFIGGRGGRMVSIELATGDLAWKADLPAPIRQTAAIAAGRVYITAEDLRTRAIDAASGDILWTSEQAPGISARDYYPVLAEADGRTLVMVRTNPVHRMSRRIGEDVAMLTAGAGLEDAHWRTLDAWTRSEEAMGTPALHAAEQERITAYLAENRWAQTLMVYDAETGERANVPGVLWASGCQGVGPPPAAMADGRFLVFYRSAYGNWTLGVAPLVALGAMDPFSGKVELLTHEHGMQPPWDTFWGTADEAQHVQVAGEDVLIVHQGTLSQFDTRTGRLSNIAGTRDSWGGFANLPWALNEWHGPGRGGVAVADGRLYWITGSRLICIAPGEEGGEVADVLVSDERLTLHTAPELVIDAAKRRQELKEAVEHLLGRRWRPLYVEMGLAGRVMAFDHSGETLEALAMAYPHLQDEDLRARVRREVERQWREHPPLTDAGAYALEAGEPREPFAVPDELRGRDEVEPLHPFAHVRAVWLSADRVGGWEHVERDWDQIRQTWADFRQSGWRLDPERGHAHANRYLAATLAMRRMAARLGDPETADAAEEEAERIVGNLAAWWSRAADDAEARVFEDVGELDAFIGSGGGAFLRMRPHRHRLGLFEGLTPDVAARIRREQPEAVAAVVRTFEQVAATWFLAGEERQVHFGENHVDEPGFALAAFRAAAWLAEHEPADLLRWTDRPVAPGDLYHIIKLGIALDAR